MQTEVIFENITERIQSEIRKATESILVVDIWLDNKDIFNELINKAKEGSQVLLFISRECIIGNKKINYKLIEKYNSRCHIIDDDKKELIHNKFYIINNGTVVITGSYDKDYNTKDQFECIIINYADKTFAGRLITAFNKIIRHYHYDEQQLATGRINYFIHGNKQLANRDDPEFAALQIEVLILKNQLSGYETEKIEINKILSDFRHRHSLELGHIILEILKLRMIKYRKYEKKYKAAEKDYKQYSKQVTEERKKPDFELTGEEMTELKKKFRTATLLCHPDKVDDKFKDAAINIFIELKAAYEMNDLNKVTEIFDTLEKGNLFRSGSGIFSEKDILLEERNKLFVQKERLESEVHDIWQSDTFSTVIKINSWDDYFKKKRTLLEQELQDLRAESFLY